MVDKVLQDLCSMRRIASSISCSMDKMPFTFNIAEHNGAPYMQIVFDAKDVHTGVVEPQFCRKWILQYTMCNSEIVRTAYKASLAAFEHECQELFTFYGSTIFSPHTDVYELISMRNTKTYNDDVRVPVPVDDLS